MFVTPGVGAVTVIDTLAVTPSSTAVAVVEPEASPVARPVAEIVAIAGLATDQATQEVTFPVVPSPNVAVAVSWSVAPVAKLGEFGVMAIEITVFTVSVADPLTLPIVAVTALDPAATPVATPALTVATAGLALVHTALAVTSAVDASL
jgi:hypothetical protein